MLRRSNAAPAPPQRIGFYPHPTTRTRTRTRTKTIGHGPCLPNQQCWPSGDGTPRSQPIPAPDPDLSKGSLLLQAAVATAIPSRHSLPASLLPAPDTPRARLSGAVLGLPGQRPPSNHGPWPLAAGRWPWPLVLGPWPIAFGLWPLAFAHRPSPITRGPATFLATLVANLPATARRPATTAACDDPTPHPDTRSRSVHGPPRSPAIDSGLPPGDSIPPRPWPIARTPAAGVC